MNAEDKMIEAIRNKNRQIEMMLDKRNNDCTLFTHSLDYDSSEEEAHDDGQQCEGEGKITKSWSPYFGYSPQLA